MALWNRGQARRTDAELTVLSPSEADAHAGTRRPREHSDGRLAPIDWPGGPDRGVPRAWPHPRHVHRADRGGFARAWTDDQRAQTLPASAGATIGRSACPRRRGHQRWRTPAADRHVRRPGRVDIARRAAGPGRAAGRHSPLPRILRRSHCALRRVRRPLRGRRHPGLFLLSGRHRGRPGTGCAGRLGHSGRHRACLRAVRREAASPDRACDRLGRGERSRCGRARGETRRYRFTPQPGGKAARPCATERYRNQRNYAHARRRAIFLRGHGTGPITRL